MMISVKKIHIVNIRTQFIVLDSFFERVKNLKTIRVIIIKI